MRKNENQRKKLKLKRETVAHLSKGEMAAAAGGVSIVTCDPLSLGPLCPTHDCTLTLGPNCYTHDCTLTFGPNCYTHDCRHTFGGCLKG